VRRELARALHGGGHDEAQDRDLQERRVGLDNTIPEGGQRVDPNTGGGSARRPYYRGVQREDHNTGGGQGVNPRS